MLHSMRPSPHSIPIHIYIRSTGTNVTHTIDCFLFVFFFLFGPPITIPCNALLTGSQTQDITTTVAAPNLRVSSRTLSSNSVVPNLTMTTVTIPSNSITSNRHHALRKSHIQMVMVMTFSIIALRMAAERTAAAAIVEIHIRQITRHQRTKVPNRRKSLCSTQSVHAETLKV